jgi:hypothetical protein
MKMRSTAISIGILLCPFLTQVLIGQDSQPRVYLQAASHGNVWNAHRDQAMEMAKDFQKKCPEVKVTILQSAADYTVLLNHIEVGLLGRDNQLQVANRDGDMLSLREKSGLKSGSIAKGVKAACELILADWKAHGPAPQPISAPPPDSQVGQPLSADRPRTDRAPEAPGPPIAAKPSEAAPARPATSVLVSSVSSGSGMTDGVPNNVSPQSRDGANSLGLTVASSEQGGAEILRIEPDSSASAARLHVGDVIISVNGKRVRTVAELTAFLNNRPSRLNVRLGCMFHTNLGWMAGAEKVLTVEGEGK